MENNLEELIFRATICERIDKYEEMVKIMKQAISLMKTTKIDSQVKVRNLFSVAYKNLAGTYRSSHRVLTTELTKHEKENYIRIVKEYLAETEKDLHRICDDVLFVIDDAIITSPSFSDTESKVFFLKMKGDYLRYKAEVNEMPQIIESSRKNYMEARELAKDLKTTNPVKLGLSLNFSVYLYEIAKDCPGAIEVAKEAFDEAIAGLDDLSEDHYKDSTLIMQLLRDNMTLWTNPDEGDQVNDRDETFERNE